MSENALLASRIAELERQLSTALEDARQQRDMKARARVERDALAAKLESLQTAAEHILVQKRPEARRKAFAILTAVVKSTSRQCLAEIKAQAVRDFVYWGTVNLDPEFAEFKDCAETFVGLGCPNLPREVL